MLEERLKPKEEKAFYNNGKLKNEIEKLRDKAEQFEPQGFLAHLAWEMSLERADEKVERLENLIKKKEFNKDEAEKLLEKHYEV